MTTLLSSGKSRLASSAIRIIDGQTLNLSLVYDNTIPENFRSVLVQRKTPNNEYDIFSIGHGPCELNAESLSVEIPLPGTYRVLRQSLENFDINVGVDYSITLDATDPDQPFAMTRSDKDVNGIFTTLQYYRTDGSLAKSSILSGGTTPEYTIRTETWYDSDGETIISSVVYNLSYVDGELVQEIFD